MIMIIDQHLVVGGSANYTNAAETRNAENVLFFDSADIAGRFLGRVDGFNQHQAARKTDDG